MNAISPREPASAISRAIVMAASQNSGDSDLQALQLVFVYGTLKRGQPNHHQLAGSAFRGEAELPGLALYDLGPFPMAIACDGANACISGELYAVSTDHLAALDRFEGAPRLYQRQSHQLSDGRAVWIYVGRPRQVRHVTRIVSGVWQGSRSQLPAVLIPLAVLLGSHAWAGDLRRDCLALERSHGQERIAIANRIGHNQSLTKTIRLAEAQPGDTRSLYRWSDVRQVCQDL
jgi:gamma-glutamylcyclotransferase (GGCT)/AIG2-like uncharacterized protein YtfP